MPRNRRAAARAGKQRAAQAAAALERATKALQLKRAGATYRQIAAQLQVSLATVFFDVQGALADARELKAKEGELLRELEHERLDDYTLALQAGIRAGDPRAIAAAVQVSARRAKLLGLDAPTLVTTPAGGPVATLVVHQELPNE